MKMTINNFAGGIAQNLSDNISSFSRCKECANVDFSSGAIEARCGFWAKIGGKEAVEGLFDNLPIADSGLCGGRVILYKKVNYESGKHENKLLIEDLGHNIYYLDLPIDEGSKFIPLGVKFNDRVEAVVYNLNGEDTLIMVSPKDNMVVWDGVNPPETIVDAPQIISMAIHYERLFAVSATDPYALYFSDDLDPTNWSISVSDAGFIKMQDERGKLKKVISFNDYLYVFRERGISRVYANTVMQTSFYVNHLFTAGGTIYDKTITLCGNKVFFAASSGFYSFDGSSCTKRLENLFPIISDFSDAEAVYHNGKYYLLCSVDLNKIKKFYPDATMDEQDCNNAIIEINTEDYSCVIYTGLGAVSVCEVDDGESLSLLVLNKDANMPFFELIENKKDMEGKETFGFYITGLVKLNNSKDLTLIRKVSASVLGSATVLFYNESGELSEEIVLSSEVPSSSTCFSGEKVGIIILLNKSADRLESLSIDYT